MCKNRSPTARVRFFVRERVRLDSCRSLCFHNSSQCRRCTVTRSSYPSCMQNIPLCFPRHTITNAQPTPTTDERCASIAYIYIHTVGESECLTTCKRFCVLTYAGISSMSSIVAPQLPATVPSPHAANTCTKFGACTNGFGLAEEVPLMCSAQEPSVHNWAHRLHQDKHCAGSSNIERCSKYFATPVWWCPCLQCNSTLRPCSR